MAWSRAVLAVIVASVVAACGTSSTPSPTPVLAPTDSATTVTGSPAAPPSSSPAATDVPRSPSLAPTPSSPVPTPVPVPPKPTGVFFREEHVGDDAPTSEITQTVTWAAPRSEGVEIRVYGVTECMAKPANPSPDTDGPCLVEHTALPASVRTLLASAPASDGGVSWSWTGTFDCGIDLGYDPGGPVYHAVVLAAYGASDHSIFAIAAPGRWWQPGPLDTVC